MMSNLILILTITLVVIVNGQYPYGLSSNRRVPYGSTASSVRYRYECRNIFPHRSEMIPNGVVFTGSVEDIKPDSNDDRSYMATVLVRRVFHGPSHLRKRRVTVSGFGDSDRWCHSNVRRGDSWIFVLQRLTNDYFRLNSSLIKVNLNNLEKIMAILDDEPYRKLTTVNELPCERKYCPNNGICVEDRSSPDGTKCECLTYCKPSYAPVCGSNDETFNNECELRLKSCYAGRNWFVKSLSPCPTYSSSSRTTSYSSSSSSSYRPSPSSSSSSSTSSTNYSIPYRSNDLYDRNNLNKPSQSRTITRTHSTHRTVNRYQY